MLNPNEFDVKIVVTFSYFSFESLACMRPRLCLSVLTDTFHPHSFIHGPKQAKKIGQ